MKIIEHINIVDDEPMDCHRCEDMYNGFHWVRLEIAKGFIIKINLCDKCYRKLKRRLKLNE